MLSPATCESSYASRYVEEYLDLVESLPFDLQRNVSLMREIDAKYQEILKELDEAYEKHKRETDPAQRRRLMYSIQRSLIRSQELGDEKIQIVSQMVELVENRVRQVDSHVEFLEPSQEPVENVTGQEKKRDEVVIIPEKSNGKRSRRQKNHENRENSAANLEHGDEGSAGTPKEKKVKVSKKKKRAKAKTEREASAPDVPIDPNEPTYCLCDQVSYGEMIGCDNEECPIEWFHFSCVGLQP